MTSFSESRLELFPTKWQVTVSFDTLILENGAGAEMRYSRIVEPRFSFSASDMILTKAEYDYLKAFFEARKGKFQGFRFTNPLDYQTSGVEVELATDITTQGILIETATAGEYQLVKRYTVAGVNCYKTIRKVKAGTTVFYSGGSPTPGPTIDLNSGIVTGASGAETVSCEYDLMVRFDQDEIELTHIAVESAEYGSLDAYRVVGLQLVEDNYPKVYGYIEADFADLDFTFVPSPLPEVTKGTNTVTRIEASQSQKQTRISFSENKAIYKFGDNVLYQPEVDIFYTLFLACMGRKKAFTYDEVGVRFSSDQLTLTLEVWDGNNSVWQLAGLEVVGTEPFIGPPPPLDGCSPQIIEFSDNFEAGFTWTFRSTVYVGGNNSGNASAVTERINTGGDPDAYIRTTLNYGGVPSLPFPALSGGILTSWDSPFSYIPSSASELIEITWSISAKRLDSVPGVAPYELYAVQDDSVTILVELDPVSSWSTLSITFSLNGLLSVIPGTRIRFGIRRRNAIYDSNAITTQTGMDNFYLKLDISCP